MEASEGAGLLTWQAGLARASSAPLQLPPTLDRSHAFALRRLSSQGVALAAKTLGCTAVICMPFNSPGVRRADQTGLWRRVGAGCSSLAGQQARARARPLHAGPTPSAFTLLRVLWGPCCACRNQNCGGEGAGRHRGAGGRVVLRSADTCAGGWAAAVPASRWGSAHASHRSLLTAPTVALAEACG